MNTIMEGTDNLFASIRTLAATLRHRATSLLLKTVAPLLRNTNLENGEFHHHDQDRTIEVLPLNPLPLQYPSPSKCSPAPRENTRLPKTLLLPPLNEPDLLRAKSYLDSYSITN
ncbi:phosphatidylcholine-hydrolyzing phospholipase D (PLD) family [Chlamydia trachomatis A/HAR-13]|uniref:Phosphatidylcholine-hydrolyzing phospholipase D (PLD) family n=2 Tax=Chlamydia trachomatis TaxID=813 RepID=A0A0H2X0H1_CHLTA|nr:hypothetical protein [Chlamydia trachomatis]AAX50409.1 phosphatidylcholine-hydrolyzing phospholipase D (PLD) family [Chlamydia trachomatis A/HAR-13]ABX82347.1 phosphatidylcholine-hydrolyzing phospholipase D [Chlamydia trachomatis A2497]ABX82348.1 phosphatidylcholine-hydrolyzing phospholipase D [Chlamydia trachomatis]